MHLGFEEAQIPNLPDGYGALTLMDGPQHFLGLLLAQKFLPMLRLKVKYYLLPLLEA